MKGGTEALSFFLTLNTHVAMPVDSHSTFFFTLNYAKGVDWYRQQMVCATKDQVCVRKLPLTLVVEVVYCGQTPK